MANDCAAVLALLLCDVRWDVRDSALDVVGRIAQLAEPGMLKRGAGPALALQHVL